MARALPPFFSISLATIRARVEDAIRKLDYIPNRMAGSLSSQKNQMVAVVVPSINHSIFAEALDIMSDLFESNGYQVLIGNSGWSLDKESDLVKTALSRGAEGIVLTGYRSSSCNIRPDLNQNNANDKQAGQCFLGKNQPQ